MPGVSMNKYVWANTEKKSRSCQINPAFFVARNSWDFLGVASSCYCFTWQQQCKSISPKSSSEMVAKDTAIVPKSKCGTSVVLYISHGAFGNWMVTLIFTFGARSRSSSGQEGQILGILLSKFSLRNMPLSGVSIYTFGWAAGPQQPESPR